MVKVTKAIIITVKKRRKNNVTAVIKVSKKIYSGGSNLSFEEGDLRKVYDLSIRFVIFYKHPYF